MWWTGPSQQQQQQGNDYFQPVFWSQASHNITGNAIFTMATIQSTTDIQSCSSPNDLKLYLGEE